jgi:hypothetical protein
MSAKAKAKTKHHPLDEQVENIIEFATNTLADPRMTDDERRILEEDIATLSYAVEGLKRVFAVNLRAFELLEDIRLLPSPWGIDELPVDPAMELCCALSAVFTIASRSVDNPVEKRITRDIDKARMKARIAPAKRVKELASEKVHAFITEVGKPVWERHPTWSPNRIAGQILSTLKQGLKAHGLKTLDKDAVRKRIEKLRRPA